MQLIKSFRKRFYLFLAVCFSVMLFSYIRTIVAMPGEITLLEGEEYMCNFKSPFHVSIKADKEGVLKLNNYEPFDNRSFVRLSDPVTIKPQKNGLVNIKMRIFGLIPLGTMKIDVIPNKRLMACGNTIGVKLDVNGVLVIGVSNIETEYGKKIVPAKNSEIRQGDLITEVNGKKIEKINDLVEQIDNSKGKKVKLRYLRSNDYGITEIQPEIDVEDKKYHIGLWVRDSTAGIGTLTFYDPETKRFGALGHGITDVDTGILIPIKNGEILESSILGVKKGQQGSPGELKGIFIDNRNNLGNIENNCEYGIFGFLNDSAKGRVSEKIYPIALRSQIKEGKASILANINGKEVEEYAIEIQKISKKNINGSKGMILKITDKRLLDLTGGIVQGMSGSPIIQNDRIVGAVTHVLVNDPTRGYGIFIESMIKNMISGNNMGKILKVG